MDIINSIKHIGQEGICSEDQLRYYLPSLPILRGDESVFSIGWANANNYVDQELEIFVKGLHFIEEKYKSHAKNDFGFGSPSPTYKLIEAFAKIDYNKAIELEKSKIFP
jgi:hypothetical protein